MNSVTLKGNLARDPEIRVVESGTRKTSVANFTLAVSRNFKNASGEKQQETTFIPCEAWDTGAELIGKYLVKGDPVLLQGSIKEDRWEDKDTQEKRSRLKIRVSNFDKLYRAPARAEGSEANEPVAVGASEGNDPGF